MEPPSRQEIELLDQIRENISDLQLNEEDRSDKNLVRFLRARNHNLDAVELMIRSNQTWQAAENVKGLLYDWEYPKHYEEDFYHAITGFDRSGNPLLLAPFGRWDIQKETALGNKEDFVKFMIHSIERLWMFLKHISKSRDSMYQGVILVDLEGLTMRQVTSLDVIEASIRSIRMFEANHPETAKAIVAMNAPWAFQLIWKLIKPFLSEHTHSKITFVGNCKEKWREAIFKHAELDQFPEYYGGTGPNTKTIFIARDGSFTNSENQNAFEDSPKKGYSSKNNRQIITESC